MGDDGCHCTFASTSLRPVEGGGFEGSVLLPYDSRATCEAAQECDPKVSAAARCLDGACYGPAEVFVDGRTPGFTTIRPVRVAERGCVTARVPMKDVPALAEMAKRCSDDTACKGFIAVNNGRPLESSYYEILGGLPSMGMITRMNPGSPDATNIYVRNGLVRAGDPDEGCGPVGPIPPPEPGEGWPMWAKILVAFVVALALALGGLWAYRRFRG